MCSAQMLDIPQTLDVFAADGAFFECPRWHEGRLWVSDFWGLDVSAISLNGSVETIATVPGSPSGLGWLPDGSMVIVSMNDNRILRLSHGTIAVYADLSPYSAGQCHDLVVDAIGRCYVPTVNFRDWTELRTTSLLRVDPDGSITVAARDLAFPNGLVITPDGRSLIVAESWAQQLTAFDLKSDGSLANRRLWAQLGSPPDPRANAMLIRMSWTCVPDGIALDANGDVWVADAKLKRVLHVREGGEVLEAIETGDLGAYGCALGGADGRTLFMCTAPTPDSRRAAQLRQSHILSRKVDVPHEPHPLPDR